MTTGLAEVLASQGYRVLLIDDDPQANATAALGVNDVPALTLNDVLYGDPTTHTVEPGSIADAIIPAGEGWDGVDLVASELALADRDYDQGVGRESRLRIALRGGLADYDVASSSTNTATTAETAWNGPSTSE